MPELTAVRGRPRTWLLAGVALFAGFLFVTLTNTVFAAPDGIPGVDRSILLLQNHLRRPWLTTIVEGVTDLGTPWVVLPLIFGGMAWALRRRDVRGAVIIATSGLGGWLWTEALKHWLERPRPSIIERLTVVTSFSYPSGHALATAAIFLGCGLALCRHLRHKRERAAVLVVAIGLTTAVGASRIYLGVHYPTDVAAGICVGFGWAFLAAAATSWLRPLELTPATDPENSETP